MDVAPDGKVAAEKITPSMVRVARRCNYPEINQAFETELPHLLGSTNPCPTAVTMEPFSTSVFKVLT